MRVRLLVDVIHDEDVTDIMRLTATQPVATVLLGREAHDSAQGVFFGRFVGATAVEEGEQ